MALRLILLGNAWLRLHIPRMMRSIWLLLRMRCHGFLGVDGL